VLDSAKQIPGDTSFTTELHHNPLMLDHPASQRFRLQHDISGNVFVMLVATALGIEQAGKSKISGREYYLAGAAASSSASEWACDTSMRNCNRLRSFSPGENAAS